MQMRVAYLIIFLFCSIGATAQSNHSISIFPKKKKRYEFEQVTTEEMIRRFVSKPSIIPMSIEGIYSVSATVTKHSKALLSNQFKDKVVDRRDNYAHVAIMRDWSDSHSDFIEVSMHDEKAAKFPITAELVTLSEGRGFLCKHFEPNGDVYTFTFTMEGDSELLQGVYTVTDGAKTITYNLTYLKIFPKAERVNQ